MTSIWTPWFDAIITLVAVVMVMTLLGFFLIWWERKLVGRIQMRLGPMRTGPYGTLQSIADAIKLADQGRPAAGDCRPLGLRVRALLRLHTDLYDLPGPAHNGRLGSCATFR